MIQTHWIHKLPPSSFFILTCSARLQKCISKMKYSWLTVFGGILFILQMENTYLFCLRIDLNPVFWMTPVWSQGQIVQILVSKLIFRTKTSFFTIICNAENRKYGLRGKLFFSVKRSQAICGMSMSRMTIVFRHDVIIMLLLFCYLVKNRSRIPEGTEVNVGAYYL